MRFRERELPLRATYGEAAPGELLALLGSDCEVEIAVRDGNAALALQALAGEQIIWRP